MFEAYKVFEIYMLTDFVRLSDDEAIPYKHDLHSQFNSRSVFTDERLGEPLGFRPMLRSWNRCLNILLMFKII